MNYIKSLKVQCIYFNDYPYFPPFDMKLRISMGEVSLQSAKRVMQLPSLITVVDVENNIILKYSFMRENFGRL